MTSTITGRRVLLASVHLRPGTPDATRELLRDYIEAFAARAGYTLDGVVIGLENQRESMTVRSLIERIHRCGADTVLVSNPVRAALVALNQLSGVRVLTLSDISSSKAVER